MPLPAWAKRFVAGARNTGCRSSGRAGNPSAKTSRGRGLLGEGALWRRRAQAVPKELWQARAEKPYKAEAPRPDGNSGGAGYVLAELAANWLATGRDFYAEDAQSTLLRICEYPHWGGNGNPKDTDLHAGALLFGGGIAYDTFFDKLSPADRGTIRNKLVVQGRRMYEHHAKRQLVQWEQNHTYIDLGGLWCAAVALYDEVPETRAWYDLGVRAIKLAVHLLDGGDGAFYEGLGYWSYGFAHHFLPLLELFRNVTGADPFAGFGSLRKLKYYLVHGTLPGGKYWLNMGDVAAGTTARANLERARYVMLKLAGEYNDPECRGASDYFTRAAGLKPASDPWTLMSWDPTVESRDPRRAWAPFHHFKDLDLVMARSGWNDDATHVALRCGPALGHRAHKVLTSGEFPDWKPAPGHVHPDLNALLIFDHGEHMLVDTGYTWKKVTREHSTVAVDGGGQMGDGERWPVFTPWNRYGRMGAFLALEGGHCYLRGEAAGGYQEAARLTRFDRHLLMMPDADSTWFLVHDVLASLEPRMYEWLLVSLEKAAATADGAFRIRSGRRALTVRLLEPAGLLAAMEPVVVEPRRSDGARRGERLAFSPAGKLKELELMAALVLHDADAPGPGVKFEGGAVQVSAGAWKDTVAPRGSGGGLASDGHHAAAREAGGRLLRWGVNDATRLSVAGREVLVSEARVSAVGAAGAMVCQLERAAEVGIRADGKIAECRLDGRPALFRQDALLRVKVPAGRHEVAWK